VSAHAAAGPSGAHGWINCPAYVTRTRGLRRKATAYTREGSAAHYVAEQIILGKPVPSVVEIEGEEIAVSEEMLDHVAVYVQLAGLLRHDADAFMVEQRVSLDWYYAPLPMPEPIFGTADLISYAAKTGVLNVVDFKYGAGVSVEVEGNEQLMIYALGAMGRLSGGDIKRVRMVIVQPRAPGEPVRSHVVSAGELLTWADQVLKPAVARIGNGDTSENSGEWCRWCTRAGTCDTLHKKALNAAKASFSEEGSVTLPAASSLPSSDLSEILDQAELISAWVSKVRAEAVSRIEGGETVPGYKLVAKRGLRKWINEARAGEELLDYGLDAEHVFAPREIRSPAQMEKVLKKGGFDPNVLETLVSRDSSGVTLVREADEREEVEVKRLPASSVFSMVD
jgi:hypothetical protein